MVKAYNKLLELIHSNGSIVKSDILSFHGVSFCNLVCNDDHRDSRLQNLFQQVDGDLAHLKING